MFDRFPRRDSTCARTSRSRRRASWSSPRSASTRSRSAARSRSRTSASRRPSASSSASSAADCGISIPTSPRSRATRARVDFLSATRSRRRATSDSWDDRAAPPFSITARRALSRADCAARRAATAADRRCSASRRSTSAWSWACRASRRLHAVVNGPSASCSAAASPAACSWSSRVRASGSSWERCAICSRASTTCRCASERSPNCSTADSTSRVVVGSSSMYVRNSSSRLPRFFADCVRWSSRSAFGPAIPRIRQNRVANPECWVNTWAEGHSFFSRRTSSPLRATSSRPSRLIGSRKIALTSDTSAGVEAPRRRWKSFTRLTTWPDPFPYASWIPLHVAPVRRKSLVTSPVSSSGWRRQAPRM